MFSHSFSDLQTTLKSKFLSFKTHISPLHRFWLFALTILSIQILCIFLSRNSVLFPVAVHSSEAVAIPATSTSGKAERCEYGRVYVYQLPPMFNRDLIPENFSDWHPYNQQIGLYLNDGFGKKTRALTGILPMNIATAWHHTNQYSTDVIYHSRILSYKCRTTDPESATAFYIPFYAGLAVGKYLWVEGFEKRDRLCTMMLRWVQNQTHWKKSNGSDHFLTLGRRTWDFRRLEAQDKEWGSAFLNMPGMERVTRFTIERSQWDNHDVGVPFPTGFHPETESELRQWQQYVLTRKRPHLFSFVGVPRPDLRTLLHDYCRNHSDVCRPVDCSRTPCETHPAVVQDAFMSSNFCLMPEGDSETRRSMFDCMIAGSIPVIFWRETADDQYRWFLPEDPESYSVFIHHDGVRNGSASIRGILEKSYNKEKIRKMREQVVETIPRLIYARTKKGWDNVKDAFDIAVEGAMKRIKEDKGMSS